LGKNFLNSKYFFGKNRLNCELERVIPIEKKPWFPMARNKKGLRPRKIPIKGSCKNE